jgi:hypothetical protein
MHCEDLVLIKRPVVIGTPRPLSKHSARNRKTCRTLLVEDVGFLQVLLAALLATNPRIADAATGWRDGSWLLGEDSTSNISVNTREPRC